MYCYHLDHWEYSDTVHLYLVHEKEFTPEEFKKMCDEFTGAEYRWDFINALAEYLIKEHGFQRMKYLAYDVNAKDVTQYDGE